MSKEIPPSTPELFDVKGLNPQSKMGYILAIFDLGKNKEKNRERRENFMKLIGKYHMEMIKSKPESNLYTIESSDRSKKKTHDEIMQILKNMSLSLGLTKEQMLIVDYLSKDRNEVERMIESYFRPTEPVTVNTPSEYLKTKEQITYLNGKTGPEEE